MSGDVRAAPDPLTRRLAFLACVLAAWLYLGRLGDLQLQRGNEAMYASPPLRMLETSDYLMPRWENRDFLDKPPLTYWILAASYRVLGVSIVSEKLPGALCGLATAILLASWVRRRAGPVPGALAGLALALSYQFATVSLTFAADTFLTLAITLAVLALDAACRDPGASDAAAGSLAGAALAAAFYAKGLVGIALPAGAVAAGLLFDRTAPVRWGRRGAWALATLLVLLAPWHWGMHRRLGAEFWRVFYWENQFLRGATPRFMQMARGPFFYVGVLAWGMFPWSLLLPSVLGRGRATTFSARLAGAASRVFVGWGAVGLLFWSLLVMKREVYLVTVLPAIAALFGEGAGSAGAASGWRRLPWIATALVPGAGLVLLLRSSARLTAFSGSASAVVVLGAGLAALAAALAAGAAGGRNPRTLFATACASGLLLLAVQNLDIRLGRFDPLPAWGARVRGECAGGCDGFLYGSNFNSIDFYSRFDWTMIWKADVLPGLMTRPRAFVVMWTSLEPSLSGLPASCKWEVLDRRPAFRSPILSTALGVGGAELDSLSLVRIERAAPR